jgi:hypothetical protein
MKITGTVTIRISPGEIEEREALRSKGIRDIDCWRRGKDMYVQEIMKSSAVAETATVEVNSPTGEPEKSVQETSTEV